MIRINNGKFEIPWRPGMTIRDLLQEMRFTFPRLIVSVNGEVIPDEQWDSYVLKDGDDVRVIHMMAGG